MLQHCIIITRKGNSSHEVVYTLEQVAFGTLSFQISFFKAALRNQHLSKGEDQCNALYKATYFTKCNVL